MSSIFDTQNLVNSICDAPELIHSVFGGDSDEVRSLIYKKADVNVVDSERRSALHAAAYLGDSEIIELLILSGAHINAKDSKWITPLHRACASRLVFVILNYLLYSISLQKFIPSLRS